MSSSVDQRVVQMQFDNAQFERGIRTSTDSLEKFEKSLQLSNATKGLNEVEKAARGLSLANLASSVESISARFSNLGIVGTTALQNITNSALNLSKNLVKSLTVDPVSTGLTEYETKMNAITTILTNTQDKGTTLDDVNKALAELNTYADQTIYNFAEMTRNIGTFTAAGVDLETSTKAIKGIANLAAGSGSSAQQASTAMYQLSQALAAGRVSLQDWNSVVNAGMGGQLFQNALKETAKQMGIVVDESVSFRESISATGGNESWLTSDVLIKTLEKFADDDTLVKAATQVKTFTQLLDTMKESVQSGWAVSWEYIIGDREQAITLLTGISDAFNNLIGPAADARNEMLAFWNQNGGRQAVIDGLANSFNFLLKILNPISTAFRNIFPPTTGAQLVDMSNRFLEFTKTLQVSDKTISNIGTTFEGLFSILSLGQKAFLAIAGAIGDFVGYVAPAGGGLFEFTASLGEFFIALNDAAESTDFFNTVFEKIGTVVVPIANFASAAVGALVDALSAFAEVSVDGIENAADRLAARLAPFGILGDVFAGAFLVITSALNTASGIFLRAGSAIANAVQDIGNAFSSLDSNGALDLFNSGLLGVISVGLYKFVNNLSGLANSADGFVESIKGILDGVGGSLEAFQNQLKAGTLVKIASAIAVLAASLVVLSLIDSDKLAGALAAISVLFAELFVTMSGFNKIVSSDSFTGIGKVTVGMIALSTAILILSSAVKKLSDLDWEGLVKGLVGVAVLMRTMTSAVKRLSADGGAMVTGSLGLIALATAIKILASAVGDMAALDLAGLAKGLSGVGILLAEISAFLKLSDLSGVSAIKATGFIALAAAIKILASAVSVFAQLDVGQMVKGLSSVGIVLGELAAFTKLTGNASKVISTAVSMNLLAASMLIFASAISKIGSMPIETIGKGLLGMAGALGEMIVALNFMPKNLLGTGAGLIAVSTAIVILSKALQTMGSLSLEQIGKGLLALGGSLAIVAAGLYALNGSIGGAAAITIFAGALALLTPSLMLLSTLSIGGIVTSLVTLAGAFAVLGVAATALTPLIPSIFALSGSIALLGVGVTAIGGGILMLATGLTALSVAGTAAVGTIVVAISGLIGLIPMLLEQIGNGIVALAGVIGNGAPAIFQAMTAVWLAMIQSIATVGPEIITTVVSLLVTLVQTIADKAPEFVEAGMQIIIAVLDGINNNIEQVTQTAIDVVLNFVSGIESRLDEIINAGVDLIIAFLNGIGTAVSERGPELTAAGFDLAGNLMLGLVKGLGAGISSVVNSIKNVGLAILNGFKEFFGIASPSKVMTEQAGYIIEGLIQGFKDNIAAAVNGIKNVGTGIINGFKDLLGIHSPSVVMNELGHYIVQGLAEGITEDMSAEEAAEKKAQNIVNAFKTKLNELTLDNETLDLEYELWENTLGLGATDAEKNAKKTELLVAQLQNQAAYIQHANAEYTATLQAMGADSEATQEAYNKYLQAQIDMAELVQQVSEAQNTAQQAQKDSLKAYTSYMAENKQTLLDFGFTLEQIEESAKSASGYNPEQQIPDISKILADATTKATQAVDVVLQDTVPLVTQKASTEFNAAGQQMSAATATGITENGAVIQNGALTTTRDAKNAVSATTSEWTTIGRDMDRGIAKGLTDNSSIVTTAAQQVARQAYNAAKQALGIQSPSKEFAKLGMFSDQGFAKGISKFAYVADLAVEKMGEDAISRLGDTIAAIQDRINSDSDMNPVITPVLDLSDVRNKAGQIGSLISPKQGIQLAGTAARVRFTSATVSQASYPKSAENKATTQVVNNNYTQNNYSPKSLSRLELYRQSKNLFALQKGLVNG